MKLRLFQSAKGDCLLLQSGEGHNILCDGGMSTTMRRHVREPLGELVAENGGKLDVVYVSHIDQDHISGVLQLLYDALDWRVYDHHRAQGDDSVRKPHSPRPPEIGALWHNAFADQVGDEADEIGALLAAAVPVLYGTAVPEFQHIAHTAENIANSIPEAIKVSKLCTADYLGIPVNLLPGADAPEPLLFFDKTPRRVSVGSLKITLLAPSKQELRDLREGWHNWLRDKPEQVPKITKELRRRIEAFANGSLEGTPFDLGSWNGVPNHEEVSPPNVASLVLMVEEDGKRALLTGDSHPDMILDGLKKARFLDDGHIHLDVLKVQHHGSEHNMTRDFLRKVSADHYVFCGNGAHGNPEPSVLKMVHAARRGASKWRARAPMAEGRKFTFWFSTTSDDMPEGRRKAAFLKVEKLIGKLVTESEGQMAAEWVHRNYRTITP